MATSPDAASDLPEDVRANLAARFEWHGRHIYGAATGDNRSPLYAALSLAVADDPAVLALVVEADRATQIPNLLFAAVHYLLLGDPGALLAAYYPDLTPTPRPIDQAYPAFRAYCLAHAEALRALVTTQRVQTNEARRCAALLPAFALVAARGGDRPLAQVEIGPSAGLLMAWDRYGYTYHLATPPLFGEQTGDLRAGDAASPVRITTTLHGKRPRTLTARMPTVAYRVGLDLHPIDARDDDATRWLRALIWPEHADRQRLLQAALDMARAYPPQLTQGDAASDTLTALLEQAPSDATLCVYHCFALNQMPVNIRDATLARVADYARQHPERAVYRIAQEWYGEQYQPEVRLTTYRGAETSDELLAFTESHGRWLDWRHRPD